jgi:hypothetical protein
MHSPKNITPYIVAVWTIREVLLKFTNTQMGWMGTQVLEETYISGLWRSLLSYPLLLPKLISKYAGMSNQAFQRDHHRVVV